VRRYYITRCWLGYRVVFVICVTVATVSSPLRVCICDRAQKAMGASSDRETDIIRETLLDTNPWLLGITVVVTLLHTLFDILAFKNDVQVSS